MTDSGKTPIVDCNGRPIDMEETDGFEIWELMQFHVGQLKRIREEYLVKLDLEQVEADIAAWAKDEDLDNDEDLL